MYVPHFNEVTHATIGRMCSMCGASCFGAEAQRMHTAYHANMVSREESRAMSAVAWCDPGGHAFKSGVPGSQSGNPQGTPVMALLRSCDRCAGHTTRPETIQDPEGRRWDLCPRCITAFREWIEESRSTRIAGT